MMRRCNRENLYSTEDVQNLVRFRRPARRIANFIQVRYRRQAYGITQIRKNVAMHRKGRGWKNEVASCFPTWRQPDVVAIAAGFGLGRRRSYPGVFGPIRRLCG